MMAFSTAFVAPCMRSNGMYKLYSSALVNSSVYRPPATCRVNHASNIYDQEVDGKLQIIFECEGNNAELLKKILTVKIHNFYKNSMIFASISQRIYRKLP